MDTNLVILIWVGIFAIIAVCSFLVKLLFDLSKLFQSATKASEMIQTELEPTLKELKETANSLKSIAGVTQNQFEGFQKALNNVMGATNVVTSKMQGLFGGVLKGIKFGMNLFKK